MQVGIKADPRGYTDGCGQVCGHVVHDGCDPSWHTVWHMYWTGSTDVCAKRERSCGPTRTSVPLSGVYVIAWLIRDDRLLISIRNSFFSGSSFGKNSKVKCNTPDVTFPICTPTLAVSGLKLFYFLGFEFLSSCVVSLSCISFHVIMCITFAYMFISCIRVFSPLSVLHSGASFSSGGHF